MTIGSNIARSSRSAAIALGAAAVLAPSLASAQDDREREVTVGLGVQVAPSHLGADRHKIFPMPFLEVLRPGEPMPYSAGDDNPAIPLIQTTNFSLGPTLNLRARRKESNVGAPVGDIDLGVEPGIYVEAYPVPSIRVRADARIGINGHDGLVGDLAVDYILRSPDQRLVAGFGPRVRWGNGEFEYRYFGVSPEVATRTGLETYGPDGGIHAVGLQASGHYRLSDRWGIYAMAGYDRLVGAGDKSPIVQTYGSENQFYGGAALTYRFNLRL